MPEARKILTNDVLLDEEKREFTVKNKNWEMKFSYSEVQAPAVLKALEETYMNFNFFMWDEKVVTHICK